MANKTKEELNQEIETQQRKKFIEEIEKVQKKHGYQVVAMLNFSQSGVYPTLGVDKVKEKKKEDNVVE